MKGLSLLAVTLVLNIVSLAQSEQTDMNAILPKIVPPSPEAALITKGGNFNVGLFTGTAQFSVPIYTLQSKGIQLPISLNYSSNGVKVNQPDSRVGIDWILNAGGVITRTIMDEDDDSNPLSLFQGIPGDNTWANYVAPMYQSQGDVLNTQPDEFSYNFNGYSGKFYYDSLRVVHKQGMNALKIERNYTYESLDWDFKVTDGNGVIYFFGGDTAREKTKTVPHGVSLITPNEYKYTSWYLRQIVTPNGDSVKFVYDALDYGYVVDVSQTADIGSYSCSYPGIQFHPGPGVTTIKSDLIIQGVILNRIVTNDGTVISFFASEKPGLADKKFDSVIVTNINNQLIKKISLVYDVITADGFQDDYFNVNPFVYNRLFLKEVIDYNGGNPLKHVFTYNDPGSLPPMFSFAQDHLGYFNGKHNRSLLPAIPIEGSAYSICPDYETQDVLSAIAPFAADREPDFASAVKGTLQKISYPTGGTTTIDWEPNTVFKNVPVYPDPSSQTLTQTGTGFKTGLSATSIPFPINYNQFIHITSSAYASVGGSPIDENFVTIELQNSITSEVVYSQVLLDGQMGEVDLPVSSINTFQLVVIARGSSITGQATITYRSGDITFTDSTLIMPGLRVRQISNNPNQGSSFKKVYLYSKSIDHLEKSSGIPLDISYTKDANSYISCLVYNDNSDFNLDIYGIFGTSVKQVTSANLANSFLAGQPNILYSTVIEADDSLLSHGATVHYYRPGFDYPGVSVRGDIMMGLPFTNNGYMGGVEDSMLVYKKSGMTFTLIDKTNNYYSYDTTVGHVLPIYIVSLKYILPINSQFSETINPTILAQFNIGEYDRITNWVKLDSTVHTIYDDASTFLQTRTINQYNNLTNFQPTQVTVANSKNENLVKKIKYTSDVTGTVFTGMLAKNMVLPVIEEQHEKDGNILFFKKTGMAASNNTFLPSLQQLQVLNNPIETRINFNSYDEHGNITEQQKANDVKEVYLWGYHGVYPVAKVVGSDYDTVKAFVNQAILDNTDGQYTDQQVRDELNKIRIGLDGTPALVTTYTYAPLIGITSETDPNDKTTFYEYDAANRLKNIKDYQGNIIKNFRYNYASSCGDNCVVLTMQTFTAYNTPSYPVGVFNGNKQYIGIANTPAEYVSLWNSNSSNQAIGVLSTNSDSLHFNLGLAANATAPPVVFGLRFYQWDVFSPTTVTAHTDSLSFVDWGDGSRELVTQTREDMIDNGIFAYSTVLSILHNDIMFKYVPISHSYSSSQPRTITVFHNETTTDVTINFNGIDDLTQDAHIRGYYPEKLMGLAYDRIGNSSDTAVKNISKLTELVFMDYTFYVSPTLKHNNWQSLNNSHKLKWLKIHFRNGQEIVSNLKVNFPDLRIMELFDYKVDITQTWGGGGFSNAYLILIAQLDNSLNAVALTASELDTILNAEGGTTVLNGYFGTLPTPTRTAASDTGYNDLISRGWTLEVLNP